MEELDREIRETLRDIFEYLGIKIIHSEDATVRAYMERLIKKVLDKEK